MTIGGNMHRTVPYKIRNNVLYLWLKKLFKNLILRLHKKHKQQYSNLRQEHVSVTTG